MVAIIPAMTPVAATVMETLVTGATTIMEPVMEPWLIRLGPRH